MDQLTIKERCLESWKIQELTGRRIERERLPLVSSPRRAACYLAPSTCIFSFLRVWIKGEYTSSLHSVLTQKIRNIHTCLPIYSKSTMSNLTNTPYRTPNITTLIAIRPVPTFYLPPSVPNGRISGTDNNGVCCKDGRVRANLSPSIWLRVLTSASSQTRKVSLSAKPLSSRTATILVVQEPRNICSTRYDNDPGTLTLFVVPTSKRYFNSPM